jgi:hypothetical protein
MKLKGGKISMLPDFSKSYMSFFLYILLLLFFYYVTSRYWDNKQIFYLSDFPFLEFRIFTKKKKKRSSLLS